MKFEKLPLDLLGEIFLHLLIIERARISITCKSFNKAVQNCKRRYVDYQSFRAIFLNNEEEFEKLLSLQPCIPFKSFKFIHHLECPYEIISKILNKNKNINYFECIHTLYIYNKDHTISNLLPDIIGTKLQYTLQTLILYKMDFFIQDTEQMNTFYNNMSQLSNLRSLTFDYHCPEKINRDMNRQIVDYFLDFTTIRRKSDQEIYDEKNDTNYDSDCFSENAYDMQWDKFNELFKKLRSYLVHIEEINIGNVQLNSFFYIALSICLHPQLKRLNLQFIDNKSYLADGDGLFSDYLDNGGHGWWNLGFFTVADFIPHSLQLCSVSLYAEDLNSFRFDKEKDDISFVYLVNALTEIITASEKLNIFELFSWTDMVNKYDTKFNSESDAVFDLDDMVSNYCVSSLIFKHKDIISNWIGKEMTDLSLWKPLFWFEQLLQNNDISIKKWLQNTLQYFEFYVKVMTPVCDDEFNEWEEYMKWNIKKEDQYWVASLPHVMHSISMQCKKYNIKSKILIQFIEKDDRFDISGWQKKLQSCFSSDPIIMDLWIQFIGRQYAQLPQYYDSKQRKLCYYWY